MTRTSRRDEMELPHSMRTPSRLPSFINDVERAKRPTVVERIAHDQSLARWAKVQYGTWKDAASALDCNEKTLRDDAK